MSLPNPTMDAVPFTPLTAEFLDNMIENTQYLADIVDGVSPTGPDGWNFLSALNPTVTYNGNRSYDMVFNAVDYTSILSPGHRLKTTRTVAAPTRSTSLNGTSQSWSDSTVGGMTFTDDFVAGAWVKLSSYPTAVAGIIGRYNGTSGYYLRIDPSGQIMLIGHNAGSGNFSYVQSYQSIPLNKWVHVSAQLDMSAFTATSNTSYVMVDGVDVPSNVSRAGTNPTAFVQAGNLEVGAFNAGGFFPGKIAQAFVSSAKITQANIRTIISQGLTPSLISANSIVSAYSFDGVGTDLNTTNANNLTANGSAVATNADSPFGTQSSGSISATLDYAIAQKVAFSTNTTVTVQVPEGCTIPTSGGVTAVSYSAMKSPFGFPATIDKWIIGTYNAVDTTFGIASAAFAYYAFPALGINSLPIGEWRLKGTATVAYSGSSSATILGRSYMTHEAVGFGASTNESASIRRTSNRFGGNAGSIDFNTQHTVDSPLSITSAGIPLRWAFRVESAAGSFALRHLGAAISSISFIELENAYL